MLTYEILLSCFLPHFVRSIARKCAGFFHKDCGTLPVDPLNWLYGSRHFMRLLQMRWQFDWDIFRQDLKYMVRTLWRTPGFTFTAILIIAVGVGATTAAFSIADHVLIRPLPFPRNGNDWKNFGKLPPDTHAATFSCQLPRLEANEQVLIRPTGALYKIFDQSYGRRQPERLEGSYVTSDIMPYPWYSTNVWTFVYCSR